jgi:hypothetical protein
MSAVKTKTLINDLLSYDSKSVAGGIQLDKNVIECKKIQKTIKAKSKEIEKKTAKHEDVTMFKADVEKLTVDLINLYSDRLVILIGAKEFNPKIIDTRLKLYSTKIDEYKKEIAEKGENNYNIYKKQESDKIQKTKKDRNIMTRDNYFAKIMGDHEKANIERKLTYNLFKLYEKFKNETKSTGLKSDIIEKETLLKNYHIKQSIKQINSKQMTVFINRVKDITKMYIDDMTSLLNVDDNKLQNFNIFVKSKSLKSSKTSLYKNMVWFSDYYKLIIDKTKDEKNVEVNILDAPEEKTVKHFVETNQTLKFILEKNSINTYLNKEFKNISIDNKTKNFLTYLIVVHFYNDILPLLNISKVHNVSYKKKVIEKDENGIAQPPQYVDSEKNVGLVFNRLNPNVIENVWNSTFTWA